MLSLGVSFLIIAYYQQRAHMVAAIPLRIMAAVIFWFDGKDTRGVAVYEFTFALLIAICFRQERKRGVEPEALVDRKAK